MKSRALALLTALLVVALTPGFVFATSPTVDQENDVGAGNANDGGHTFAQTFTVGATGLMSSVDLWLGGGGSVTIDIEAVDGSHLPTGPSLATGTATAPTPDGGNWVNFALSVPMSVTPGEMYAIVFATNGFAYGSDWDTDAYPNGEAYWLNASTWTALGATEGLPPDLAFRTYVGPASAPKSTATPATTSVAAPPAPVDGGVGWLLPVGLLASAGVLLAVADRRRRSWR